MDGTILDTLEDLTDSTNYALRKNGFRELGIDEVRNIVGNGLYMEAKRATPEGSDEETVKRVYNDLFAYYKDHNEIKTKAYDGIVEVIKKLKAEGIKTAVVSNKADIGVQKLAEKYFEGCFDCAMGETKGFALKPERDMVDEILNRMGVETKDAVYIGDSNVDMETSVNSEMDFIGVSWGFRGRKKLEEYGAKTIADKPEDLLKILL
ncbi:MAG: HAD family hydrolase [Lachnospiraceae bacterium]|nr:HAD family hydrolase [Lachnospiraceae bacterium]